MPFDGVPRASVKRAIPQARWCRQGVVEHRVSELQCQDAVHRQEVAKFEEKLRR
jgi:hypothetical protein